jgi:hypothetical protein
MFNGCVNRENDGLVTFPFCAKHHRIQWTLIWESLFPPRLHFHQPISELASHQKLNEYEKRNSENGLHIKPS